MRASELVEVRVGNLAVARIQGSPKRVVEGVEGVFEGVKGGIEGIVDGSVECRVEGPVKGVVEGVEGAVDGVNGVVELAYAAEHLPYTDCAVDLLKDASITLREDAIITIFWVFYGLPPDTALAQSI
uniref:Uncharacterized protein n=1 Tax=Mycena chlorophos TaxID=658473 RepID=A0ABQ0MDG7_MYCCL|nr:predicted protein [Mycena chlorophos]